jgi:formylglycine-generating enzyme
VGRHDHAWPGELPERSGLAYDENPTPGYHPAYAVGGEPFTSPVTIFPPGSYGLRDMAGNVWEWCTDWHPDSDRGLPPINV